MKAGLSIALDSHTLRLECSGVWRAATLGEIPNQLREIRSAQPVTVSMERIVQMDTSAAAALLSFQRRVEAAGSRFDFTGMDEEKQRLFDTVTASMHPGAVFESEPEGTFAGIGRVTMESVAELRGTLGFTGEVAVAFAAMFKQRGSFRYRELMYQIHESAIKALGIIALTMFLVGVVVAYQSAVQLKTYGANIFIVDMLGISILRELSPMLTAIIVAGRSGSAFAAQIGVMKMTEEIDAMRTMGFDPFHFLVLPRMLALMIMMPVLIFFADAFGMLGGMLIAHTELGLTTTLFVERFSEAVHLKHFWVGEIKGPFFALIIASIGIYRGMQVKNDTESIGANTTRSVVEAIFAVIICDALFSILFTNIGF